MSQLEDFTKGLKFGDETTLEDILKSILSGEKDLNRKTKIDNPIELAMLEAITTVLKDEKFVKTAKTLGLFQKHLKELSVSQKGWLIELLANTIASVKQQKENSFMNRMLGIEKE